MIRHSVSLCCIRRRFFYTLLHFFVERSLLYSKHSSRKTFRDLV